MQKITQYLELDVDNIAEIVNNEYSKYSYKVKASNIGIWNMLRQIIKD